MARSHWSSGCTAGILIALCVTSLGATEKARKVDQIMSSAGRLAQEHVARLQQQRPGAKAAAASGGCVNQPDCPDRPLEASETQAETSIAVDATGRHVVVGFNDFRGFSNPVLSVSGYMYSDDGGKTFTDGGQLPSPGNHTLGGERFPQIYGDPDVKYVEGCTFVYTSIGLETSGPSGVVLTLVFHRSRDCGHTWEGPFHIPPATNPNGLTDQFGDAFDAADKELMDIDPETHRMMVCWTNFTPVAAGFGEMSCTHSDNILSAVPTFSARTVISAGPNDGQGSAVRFFGNGSNKAIIAWATFPGGNANNVSYALSKDNGTSWGTPKNLTSDFLMMDEVLGNDRVNTNPSVAIDKSPGTHKNNVYVVYSNNDSRDGADVMFQRSTNGGESFSGPVAINSRPGHDRAQWFPFVTVDKNTGRVYVFYYDQGVATSGDLTRVAYLYSDDGGLNWKEPRSLSKRSFKAGWGNTTSQPNLGDYNQAVAQGGTFYASYAITHQVGFADGQPGTGLTVPDVEVKVVKASEEDDSESDSEDAVSKGGLYAHAEEGGTTKILLAENFDALSPGNLPAGWIAAHGAGPNVVPWTTTKSFSSGRCGSSNKAFHQEANDSPVSDQSRWERLFSPVMTVPGGTKTVSVDFDVCYDTEDDPAFRVLAYDGLFLRLADLTPGRTGRSLLAEAFESAFTTGEFQHYPKHLPRNSNAQYYFEDMSVWSGFSDGVKHVHLEFPGMAGSVFQLRFEYTQDSAGLCSDVRPGHSCGVSVDNVVVRAASHRGGGEDD